MHLCSLPHVILQKKCDMSEWVQGMDSLCTLSSRTGICTAARIQVQLEVWHYILNYAECIIPLHNLMGV